jgi:tRNA (guanine-N7-)-methyltransferase
MPGMNAREPITEPPGQARAIRTFVRRAGRIGSGQERALSELGPRFVLPFRADPSLPATDWDAQFGRQAPRVLEIGFGMGDASAAYAAAHPQQDLIGVEVHVPGVGALLKKIGEASLTNVRIVSHDAVEVLRQMVGARSLAAVHIWFPDPWHKKRHHKRRLVQTAFISELCGKLASGGYLHCATDWQPYAEQMLEVLSAEPSLRNRHAAYAPRPAWRAQTRFESRGQRLGHGVWDLVFERLE